LIHFYKRISPKIMESVISGTLPEHAVLLQDPASTGMPFDVTFVITEEDSDETGGRLAKKMKRDKREIKAHKLILAARSPVFTNMFLGPMKETKNVIEVKETTFDAFRKLIEYIYHVDIECKDMSLMEFYDIVKLAELYDIPNLSDELMDQMENIPLSMENLIEVASTALKYSQFEEISNAVLVSCARFLQRAATNPADQLELVLTLGGNGKAEVAIKLLELVKKLPPRGKCFNCKEEPCMVDQSVPYVSMRPGLRLRMVDYYPEAHANNSCHGNNSRVRVLGVTNNGQVMVSGLEDQKNLVFTYNSCWEFKGAMKMTFVFDC